MNNLIAILLITALSSAWAPNALAADAHKRFDAPVLAKKRVARERQFLYRAVEELNRSQEYAHATMRGLEKQIDAVDRLEPSSREYDLRAYLAWYQAYEDWLRDNIKAFEEDLSGAYSDEQGTHVVPERYSSLVDGCNQLDLNLEEQITYLVKLSNGAEQQIAGLKVALDYISSAAFLAERNRDKKRSKPEKDRRRDDLYERYKDITEAEIALMQLELKNLMELQLHYAVLIEMGRMELSWISRKAGDYEALGRLAGAVGRDAVISIEDASSRMIKLYDSDIVFFKGQAESISHDRSRIVPSGSLRTLDRMEEMTENYDRMKSRYEHHMAWLAEMAGAYRADIIELGKEK